MLTSLIIFLIGLIGAALVSFGTWLMVPAAGYIVAGVLCLSWSWLASRAAGRQAPRQEGD